MQEQDSLAAGTPGEQELQERAVLEETLSTGQVDIPVPAFDAQSIFGPPAGGISSATSTAMPQDERTRASSVASSSSTPPMTPMAKPSLSRRRTQPEPISRIFIKDLPNAEQEALSTFAELKENEFQTKGLGRSNQQEEMMVCDCVFDENEDDPEHACGQGSNCINRMTQVECLHGQCQTRGHCQNQRFSRKQYANIEIVQTEKKGFGIRAGSDMNAETFIYEYIGEVISETTFRKRIQDYANEGIQHFYFMMLQKEEYLDATKRGGKARFLNHSCNPNCYVAKWVVGKRMRMGIFAKRDILEGEELTFNYNVDRYGYDAQICYCGEPNCSGFIGGKVQTDLGTMDDLYLEALGVSEEVAANGLKGNKKKRAKRLDEDFNPVLKPMSSQDVPKIVAALRQATANRPMLVKILQRIQMTDDDAAIREVTRMHGFSNMTTVLGSFPEDEEVVLLVLEAMQKWKVGNRVKIEDSNIEEPVRVYLDHSNDNIRRDAEKLLNYWKDRPTVFRIPRKVHVPDSADDATNGDASGVTLVYDKPRYVAPAISISTPLPQLGTFTPAPVTRPIFKPKPRFPSSTPTPVVASPAPANPFLDKNRLDAILAQAQASQEAAARQAAAEAELKASQAMQAPLLKRRSEHGESSTRRKKSKLSNEAQKEKRLMKLVGEFVVKTMSKYQRQMERETFKKYAKECTQLLVDKEKRGKTYQEGKLDRLSEEKKAKLKSFIKEFTHKILAKLKARGRLITVPTDAKDSPAERSHRESTGNSNEQDNQLVNEMFGHDDEDMSMDVEEDEQFDSPRGVRSRDLTSLEESSVSTPPAASPLNLSETKPDDVRIVSHEAPQTPETPPFEDLLRLEGKASGSFA